MSPITVWSVVLAALVAAAYYITRAASRNDEDDLHDTGLAIVEFGRAYPGEAIRDLHGTADREAIFVRLHDGKAGLMRNHRNHYACHLIKPGRTRISPLPDARGFTAEFLDSPTQTGKFVFSSEKDAAEVSLWLLGSMAAHVERESAAEAAQAERSERAE